jgi:transposase-like protein
MKGLPFSVWSPTFLRSLGSGGNITAACRLAGINRKTAYRWRERSGDFKADWDRVVLEAGETLEEVARKRARARSDVLLLHLLREERRRKEQLEKGPNRLAMEELLESTDRDVDVATKQMARSIADALDLDPSNAQMWRTYKELIGSIREEDDAGDEADDEIEALRGAATVVKLQAV